MSLKDVRGENIGIIAPYKSQINLLTRLLIKDEKMRERFINVLSKERAIEVANIEIKTVDGFQGREKDAIIFSTVRNNSSGYIGFLADRRRLNVGLTRAKRALFVIGNTKTLEKGKYGRTTSEDSMSTESKHVHKGAKSWRRYVEYVAQQNLIVKMDEVWLRKWLTGANSRQQTH